MPVDLPPRTICDHNCFLPPRHDGPHQFSWNRRAWAEERNKRLHHCPSCTCVAPQQGGGAA